MAPPNEKPTSLIGENSSKPNDEVSPEELAGMMPSGMMIFLSHIIPAFYAAPVGYYVSFEQVQAVCARPLNTLNTDRRLPPLRLACISAECRVGFGPCARTASGSERMRMHSQVFFFLFQQRTTFDLFGPAHSFGLRAHSIGPLRVLYHYSNRRFHPPVHHLPSPQLQLQDVCLPCSRHDYTRHGSREACTRKAVL